MYYGELALAIPKPITTSSHPTAVSTMEMKPPAESIMVFKAVVGLHDIPI